MSADIDKIYAFQHSIEEQINEEIGDILTAAREKAEKIVADAEKEYSEKAKNAIEAETKNIKRDSMKTVSQASYEAGREALAFRNQLVCDMFDSIRKRLLDFTQSDAYKENLTSAMKAMNAEKPFYKGVTAFVKPADTELLRGLSEFKDIEVKANKSIKIGGISFFYPDGNFYVDKTFDAGFEREKAEFSQKSELQI